MNLPVGAAVVTDPAELEAHFRDHTAIHIYALADLEEPYWSASRWYRRDSAVVGLVGIPGAGTTVYAVTAHEPEPTLRLLADLTPTIPSGALITGPEGSAAAIAPRRELAWHAPYLRYRLTEPVAAVGGPSDVVEIGPDDLDELARLYRTEPGAAFFVAHMLDDATFVGIRRDGRLVAAAGTHVASETKRIAAIGAVYTHPQHRGEGLGAMVTAGVVWRLAGRADTIGLNVAESNRAARTVYERLGFDAILRYEECEVI